MSYSSWVDCGFTNVWSNGKYALDVRWWYRQDIINNCTEVSAEQVRVRSLDAYHSFYTANAQAGLGVITATRRYANVSANVSTGGSQTWANVADSRVIYHNSNGTIDSGELFIHGYFNTDVSGWDVPNCGWQSVNVSGRIPSIDRVAPITSIQDVSAQDYQTIQFNLRTDSHTQVGKYRIDGGAWINQSYVGTYFDKANGGLIYQRHTGFGARTTHTIEYQTQRLFNGVWSNVAKITATTALPNPPYATYGKVYCDGITPFNARIYWEGFNWGAGENKIFNNGGYYGVWLAGQPADNYKVSNRELNFIGLQENTTYTAYVRLVDGYGLASDLRSISFTTLSDQAKANIKVGETWRVGKVWVKVGGQWRKVKKIHVKVGNTWKVGKTL